MVAPWDRSGLLIARLIHEAGFFVICNGHGIGMERMAQVGAGAARAETRRDWVRAEEERMKRDREAQWLARLRLGPHGEILWVISSLADPEKADQPVHRQGEQADQPSTSSSIFFC